MQQIEEEDAGDVEEEEISSRISWTWNWRWGEEWEVAKWIGRMQILTKH
jgi:hypothetical protein